MLKKLVMSFLMLCLVALIASWQLYEQFKQQPLVEKTVIFEVIKGNSLDSISRRLNYKAPHNNLWLKLLAYESNLTTKLKAGEYELIAGMLPKEFLVLLSQGKVRQYDITLVEGWNFKQVKQALIRQEGITSVLSGLSDAAILKTLGNHYPHIEGTFFPDTYRYEKGTTDLAILTRAYQKMQTVLSEQWQHKSADLPLKNSYEALILASIIEKETANGSERSKIAGVFVQRLLRGMRLQTDPTVIYGMGDNYQGNIRKKDLRTKTAYNTYRIKGLPPTPIAMPSKESIYAALHPEQSDNLYFVAKGKQGLHQFSATLAEHNKAVNRYQR